MCGVDCMIIQAVLATANQKWGSLEGLQRQRAIEEAVEEETQRCTGNIAQRQRAQQWEAAAAEQAQLAQEGECAAQLCNYAASIDNNSFLGKRNYWSVTMAEMNYRNAQQFQRLLS